MAAIVTGIYQALKPAQGTFGSCSGCTKYGLKLVHICLQGESGTFGGYCTMEGINQLTD